MKINSYKVVIVAVLLGVISSPSFAWKYLSERTTGDANIVKEISVECDNGTIKLIGVGSSGAYWSSVNSSKSFTTLDEAAKYDCGE